VFPAATCVNAGSVDQVFQDGNFFGCQLNLACLSSLDDMTFLGSSDDGQRAFGYAPGDANLRA